MGTILVKNVIKRKPGFLYYVDGSGNSFYQLKMNHRRLRSKDGSWWQKEEEIKLFFNT